MPPLPLIAPNLNLSILATLIFVVMQKNIQIFLGICSCNVQMKICKHLRKLTSLLARYQENGTDILGENANFFNKNVNESDPE